MDTLDAVLGTHDTAEVLNLLNGEVVRRLRRHGTSIAIDFCDGSRERLLPVTTPLLYEPWSMDRGSVLFREPVQQVLKLATELDPIRYPDGTEGVIVAPAQRIR